MESATRNPRLEWDTVSGSSLKRKARPGIRLQTGMQFPVEASSGKFIPELTFRVGYGFRLKPQAEAASQFERLFRDAVSAGHFNRKVYPVLGLYSGTRFPLGMPFGKCVPFWAFELGRAFRWCCRWESVSQFGKRVGISSAASTVQRR